MYLLLAKGVWPPKSREYNVDLYIWILVEVKGKVSVDAGKMVGTRLQRSAATVSVIEFPGPALGGGFQSPRSLHQSKPLWGRLACTFTVSWTAYRSAGYTKSLSRCRSPWRGRGWRASRRHDVVQEFRSRIFCHSAVLSPCFT